MDLDLIDKVWEKPHIKMATYQYKVTYYFNTKIHNKTFRVGDLVLH